MKVEADPNFVFSSTDKMLFVIVDINPLHTNHQHQNTVITFLSVTSSIHQLSRRKTRRRISRCHGDAKQARESRPYFRVLPEIVVDRGESFYLYPNRVPKEEEEERMRVAVVNHDSTSETKISTNQSARSRRRAVGAVEKRRMTPPSCVDR